MLFSSCFCSVILHLLPPFLHLSYLCMQGSATAQPEEDPTGHRCLAGFYCPPGTIYMIPCPVGTFNSHDGDTWHWMLAQTPLTDVIISKIYILKTMQQKYKPLTPIPIHYIFLIHFQQMRGVNILSCYRGRFHRGLSGLFAGPLLCWSWPFFPLWAVQSRILLQTGLQNSNTLG